MMKTNRKHHAVLKRSSVYRIVSVVVFAMFLNIVNFGAFINFDSTIKQNKAVLQLENKLGRICGAVNLPIKIVNDLFNKDKSMSDNKEKESNKNNKLFALLIPVKQAKETEGALKINALAPNGGSGNKVFSKLSTAYYSAALPDYVAMMKYFTSWYIVRCMLLFLIIMLALPRGIPLEIRNFINIKFAFPVFVFNKGGIFRLCAESKGRV